MPFGDYTGKTFGYLTGISFTGKYRVASGHSRRIWLWKCACGVETEQIAERVTGGRIVSCGCKRGGKYTGDMAVAYAVYGDYKDEDITFEKFLELALLQFTTVKQQKKQLKKIFLHILGA